jgi:hypothetical protein
VFLVDTDIYPAGTAALATVFDGITTYAIENWGARRDSIHCFSGATGFSDDEWFDLEDVDPDRIYTFSALSPELLNRLHRLRPWTINSHLGIGGDPESGRHTPSLPGVPIRPTRENLAKFEVDLLLLAFTQECAPNIQSFLHRNFGTYYQWIDTKTQRIGRIAWLENVLKDARHLEVKISDLGSLNDFIRLLAGSLESGRVYRPPLRIIAPCEVPALCPPPGVSSWSWADGFNVFVGASPQLFAAYWTDTRRSGAWTEPFRHRLWIPPEILVSPGFAEVLGMYLYQYAGLHSSNSRPITFISDDASQSVVDSSLSQLAQAPRVVRAAHSHLKDWEARRRQKKKQELRQEFVRPRLDSRSATRFRLYEDHQTFTLEPPAALMSPDATWAVEVQVEQDSMDGVGQRANHYLLPRDRGSDVAPFILRIPARIDKYRLMVGRIDLRSGPFNRALSPELHLNLISSAALVLTLLTGVTAGFESDDLRKDRISLPQRDFTMPVSEPGKHLRGAISLFGSLEQSRPYTERNFWTRVFLYLSGSRFNKDDDFEGRLRNRFLKKLAHLGEAEANRMATDLARDILRLVQAKRSDRYLTLARLRNRLNEAIPTGPEPATIQYGAEGNHVVHMGIEPISANELDEQVSFLIEQNIFHMGLNLKCPSCSGQQWYPAKTLDQRVECSGCGHAHSLPPNPEWSYRLNTLVQRAVTSGTLAVLQALREMSDQSMFSFFYSPSREVVINGQTEALGELDLICLLNGDLVLGEVKSGSPVKAEYQRFQELVIRLRPQRAIVFVPQEYLAQAQSFFEPLRVEVEKHSISVSLFTLPSF